MIVVSARRTINGFICIPQLTTQNIADSILAIINVVCAVPNGKHRLKDSGTLASPNDGSEAGILRCCTTAFGRLPPHPDTTDVHRRVATRGCVKTTTTSDRCELENRPSQITVCDGRIKCPPGASGHSFQLNRWN